MELARPGATAARSGCRSEIERSLLYARGLRPSQRARHFAHLGLSARLCGIAALGDIAMTLAIFGVVALAYKDIRWIEDMHHGKYLLAGFVGLLFAIIFEQFATQTTRWEYSVLMPLVPILKVGVSPLLQMTLLTPVIFWVTTKIIKKMSKN